MVTCALGFRCVVGLFSQNICFYPPLRQKFVDCSGMSLCSDLFQSWRCRWLQYIHTQAAINITATDDSPAQMVALPPE